MKYYKLYSDRFETNLGVVSLEIECSNESDWDVSQENSMITINTLNHIIEVFAFNDIKEWLSKTDNEVEQSKGWLIRMTKTSSNFEQLNLKCELISSDSNIISSPDSGEWLDAVWMENSTHFLSIGTEDGEMLRERAVKNDFMPNRFKKELGFQSRKYSFTKYIERGFLTEIPTLKKHEQIYFHYLAATNPRKKSREYPNADDISTNLAVDFAKRTLIDRLKLKDWK